MSEAKSKGNLLENVTAILHNQTGVRVEVRIKIPVIDTISDRRRKIDVLLTSCPAGYPVQIAIECKNEKGRIGTEKIDAFIGKLKDVGIPPSHGIYVSSVGYTKDALNRAEASRIRPLIFEGLTADHLRTEISKARQSIIYALATWRAMNHFPYLPSKDASKPPGFSANLDLSKHGQGKPGLMNVLWELWITSKIPDTLGEHIVSVYLPSGYSVSGTGGDDGGGIVIIEYEVVGHILQAEGQATNLRLRHAVSNKLEKQRIDASFNNNTTDKLLQFQSENDLSDHIASGGLHIYGRIRVPKIVDSMTYWPPSKRALQRIRELRASGSNISFAKVEGTDLSRAWEEYFVADDT